MNNSPVKSELYVALENGRINLLLTSYEIQSFCATLSLFRKSFQIAKVATLYLIKLHQKLKLQNKDHLLNVAITKVMQKYHHDEITTHHIDEELKILQTFQEVS